MRRKPRARNTSRVGQIHLCAVCVENAGGYGVSEDGHTKQLTWMFEIPPESDTYARLGGRARTWFCRPCFEAVCATDPIFADRNRELELKDPAWWMHPATEAQISYLCNLLDQRMIPDKLREEIESRVENARRQHQRSRTCSQRIALLDDRVACHPPLASQISHDPHDARNLTLEISLAQGPLAEGSEHLHDPVVIVFVGELAGGLLPRGGE